MFLGPAVGAALCLFLGVIHPTLAVARLLARRDADAIAVRRWLLFFACAAPAVAVLAPLPWWLRHEALALLLFALGAGDARGAAALYEARLRAPAERLAERVDGWLALAAIDVAAAAVEEEEEEEEEEDRPVVESSSGEELVVGGEAE
jgi:hypothetical protein